MARPLRIQYPGAWYHVMNRGRRKEKIFWQKNDYEAFLKLLGKCSDLFALHTHAYSLMPNHYHLLASTPHGNLSRAMRHLDGVYTQTFNRKHKKDGVLFRGRFKSILIDKDSYGLEVVRYIHCNPVKAAITKKPEDHPWTSHRAYMDDHPAAPWLKRDEILAEFGNSKDEFHRFVCKKDGSSLQKRLDGSSWPAVLGGETFKKWVRQNYIKPIRGQKQIPQVKIELKETISPQKLLDLICQHSNCDAKDIVRPRRGSLNQVRRGFVYLGREYLKLSLTQIGSALGGLAVSAVSKQYLCAVREWEEKRGCYRLISELEKIL